MGKEAVQHSHHQKRARGPRNRVLFQGASDAVARLKRFGAVEGRETKIIYIEKRVGLKVLGAVDYLAKLRTKQKGVPFVVFGKEPK